MIVYILLFLFVLLILFLLIIYFYPKPRVETDSKNEIGRLKEYLKKYRGNGVYDYSYDLKDFQGIKLTSQHLVVGGNCKVVDFLNFCVQHNLFYPVGFDYGSSISDEISKGSIGIFQRQFGLLTDYVDSFEIMTSEGLCVASERENSELFWAVRGASAENFGIITKINFIITRIPKNIHYFEVNFAVSQLKDVINWMTKYDGSKKFSARLHIWEFTIQMKGLYFGAPRRLSRILSTLPDAWEGSSRKVSYLEALDLTEEAIPPGSHLKTYYINESFGEEKLDILEKSFLNIKGEYSVQLWLLRNEKLTQHSMNHGKLALVLRYFWDENDEKPEWQLDQLVALTQRLKLSSRNRCCLHFFDDQLGAHRSAYYGKRHRRLRKIKRLYDPMKMFQPRWII